MRVLGGDRVHGEAVPVSSQLICLDRRSRGIYEETQSVESASMCGSRQWASDVWSLSLAAFSFPSPADAPDDWPVGLGRLPPARAPAAACSGIGSIAEVSEVEVLVVGPAVTGPLEVGPAETGPALSANCGSDGRRARVRARGKRAEGRVCSVTVAAVRLKEVWLRGPEGNRRPEPPPGVHLQAVGVKTVMYWSLNKISVYGDRVHGEAVPVSSQLILELFPHTAHRLTVQTACPHNDV